MFLDSCQTLLRFQFTKKKIKKNWNLEKVYLDVCRCFLVVCSRFLVVCGRLLVVYGCLLLVCGGL